MNIYSKKKYLQMYFLYIDNKFLVKFYDAKNASNTFLRFTEG